MEPSPSPDGGRLTEAEVDVLFVLADAAVRSGLAGAGPRPVHLDSLPPALRRPGGMFVTLEVAGELNGCMGSVTGDEPLGAAVARLARAAAFGDPRLPALTPGDYPWLEFKLSLLSPLAPLAAGSEDELAAVLRPGVDGVVLRRGPAQATFLPAVWEKLPDPVQFLRHLEAKAGLRPGWWDDRTLAWRYTAAEYRRRAADIHGRAA